jgi:DnaK suppressor protein
MDENQKKELKARIETEIVSVEAEIVRLKELVKPVAPDNAIGRLSRMEAINEKSIKEANMRSAQTRVSQLKAALSKLEDTEFGLCRECGQPIPMGRLLARPESSHCVQCAL